MKNIKRHILWKNSLQLLGNRFVCGTYTILIQFFNFTALFITKPWYSLPRRGSKLSNETIYELILYKEGHLFTIKCFINVNEAFFLLLSLS